MRTSMSSKLGLCGAIVLLLTVIPPIKTAASEPPLEPSLKSDGDPNNTLLSQTGIEITSSESTSDTMSQINSVSQLSDVQTTDWAFQSLQSLVERYGCIAGYPDKTYKGNRGISRYEFASGLNACLDRINELIASGTTDLVRKDDLLSLQRLQQEFAAELATMRSRIDALEVRAANLEAEQFSATTKLNGATWFNLTDATSSSSVKAEGFDLLSAQRGADGQPVTRQVNGLNVTFRGSLFLILQTSFTGRDILLTTLSVGSGISPANLYNSAGQLNPFGVPVTDITFGPASNVLTLRELAYTFPVGDTVRITAGPRINWPRYFDYNQFTFFLNGTTSYKSTYSPLFNPIARGSGAVIEWSLNPQFLFKAAYLGRSEEVSSLLDDSSNPAKGLFNGTTTITGELTYSPSPTANIRLTYTRGQISPLFGQIAFTPPISGVADDGFGGALDRATADIFGLNFDWRINPNLGIFGRYAYASTYLYPIAPVPIGQIAAQSYQIGLAFPDLGRPGALATISYVAPFALLDGRRFLVSGGGNGGVQYEIEAAYSLPLSDRISVIPAFYFIGNANNFTGNPAIYVGNVRLQFLF